MEIVQILQTFGFTEVEARVYLQLCGGAPATGYELAKALQISRANVYAALESLVMKGAAEKTPTAPVKYAPVHPDDLVARLGARTTAFLDALQRDLPRPSEPVPGDFWVVAGAEAIFAKAAELIGSARRSLVADLWSEEVTILGPALELAQARGVQVTLIAIGPVKTAVKRIYRHNREEEWAANGRSITLVADGARVLTGNVSTRAVYTTDPTLVELADEGLFHDMLVLEMQRRFGLSDEALLELEKGIRGQA
ncbi:MAG TPA: helix-turn-helix domain-containing protein [Symbiobacteriaceae bacterium]|nr:helix-turn-helix domain-containing protein [Symbiobacteriaceae bacterium]